ncbi:CvpA family protein [Aquimarina sp. AD10]|uniref:Colicin V production protein n=1 Tax=Aquimarina aggregata TaxID=1642818 RepID=A0A163BF99_9FLAO|nr:MULTISPECIES: CvpA family protein [Aquimarina]AXT61735.1 CvpA family protein [Aquimarina sp. AD10]KZS41337.1 colicin V production protein [Aquimarina aggregata]RKN00915.1 CvpA family protein [Aquimarina sp. AD10]
MNYIDIILGILLLWGLINGFSKGLFSSLASLVALVVGIYIAVHFSHIIGEYLQQYVDWPDGAMKLTAFALTFILVVVLVSLAGKLLTKIADYAALGVLNKILGAAFGVLKFAFIASVVIIFFEAINRNITLIKADTLNTSILYTPVRKLAPMVLPTVLKETPKDASGNALY